MKGNRRYGWLGLALAAGLAGWFAPAAALAEGVAGVWSTKEDKSRVEIKACENDDGKLCGAIVWLREPLNEAGEPKLDKNNPQENLRKRPLLGLPLLTGFEKTDDPALWEEGEIYNPEDGEIYSSTLTLQSLDVLDVRGYVGIPLFGKSQEWKRVK